MEEKRINLALQGGGAHGAFAWGVLDRLLDERWLRIDGISGTSAGALNGAALKAGLAIGGIPGRLAARDNLDHIWAEVGRVSDNRMVRWMHSLMPVPRGLDRLTELFSPFAWMDGLTRIFSPYDYGPLYSNPLDPILRALPHPRFAASRGPRFFVTATNVRTGRVRIFANDEITCEALLASACLPTLFRAVETDDPATGKREAYWDGGYSGNPALFPLFDQDLPRDIVIVNINPMMRSEVPKTPADIQDRMNEISFNSSLLRELRAINFVKRLYAEDRLQGRPMKNVLVHMILDDTLMNSLTARTKLMPDPGLLSRMKAAGQAAAEQFLTDHADALNDHDTVDLPSMFS
ncbi:patatin-like phospholipase family protein [Paracoccus sp. TK19116]|uniref:Patatin-like phospholipase family protein n=1 Tax=Paracoccus albicereus TaxID=2922394 RepID=A0ABT1MNL7_9RHOB|nr:patatin-like phospholipase family protein [Paracoccus albicereus]MCQ0969880.1 patatin-like phospholipase family protein [Paracoccus albicereus]